jgi:hypothetical protein
VLTALVVANRASCSQRLEFRGIEIAEHNLTTSSRPGSWCDARHRPPSPPRLRSAPCS